MLSEKFLSIYTQTGKVLYNFLGHFNSTILIGQQFFVIVSNLAILIGKQFVYFNWLFIWLF